MVRRNRCLEGTEDGQMTPRRYPNFYSYIKNLCFYGITDGKQMTPRGYPNFNSYIENLHFLVLQTEKLIRGGLGNLIGSSRYSCLKKVPPAHALPA
jgi:hypothetical protein